MKSKRVEEYIDEHEESPFDIAERHVPYAVQWDIARNAALIAEEDARNRAIVAFCETFKDERNTEHYNYDYAKFIKIYDIHE
jgi:hypothetical protein